MGSKERRDGPINYDEYDSVSPSDEIGTAPDLESLVKRSSRTRSTSTVSSTWHRDRRRLSWQRTVYLLLLLLILSAAALAVTAHRRQSRSRGPPHYPLKAVPPSLQLAGYDTGTWTPPAKIWNQTDLVRVWGGGPDAATNSDTGKYRAIGVSSWDWTPSNGLGLRAWDPVDFVMRCMNSARGFLLVGGQPRLRISRHRTNIDRIRSMITDSVTVQQSEALEWQMHLGSRHEVAPATYWFYFTDTTQGERVWMIHNNTIFRDYLKEWLPHVPPSRFDEPFFRIRRHDVLMDPPELVELAQDIGLNVKIHERSLLQKWEQYLPVGDNEVWEGQESSILLLNTGAHWTAPDFDIPHEHDLERLSRAVASKLFERLVRMPRWSILYRTTSPGHPNCDRASTPVYPALPFMNALGEAASWNWHSFGRLSDIWADALNQVAPDGHAVDTGDAASRGRVLLLNVTDMTGQRPDAHRGNTDCLHVSWTRLCGAVARTDDLSGL